MAWNSNCLAMRIPSLLTTLLCRIKILSLLALVSQVLEILNFLTIGLFTKCWLGEPSQFSSWNG